MKLWLTAIILLLSFFRLTAQQPGCTDPRASNFSPQATVNNGSCRYPSTIHQPDFIYELPYEARESSGLVFHDSLLWTHNDSKHKAELYALSPIDGRLIKTIKVSNAVNIDWEEIAKDDQYMYVGDVGNNAGQRRLFQIYRIPLDALMGEGDANVAADTIMFTYPDQPTKLKYLNHNHDCEAFVVSGDSIYLFSKNWADGQCKLYRIPAQKGLWVAEAVNKFDSRGLITGADYQPETGQLMLVGYTKGTWMPFLWILHDFEGNNFFSGNKRRINLKRLITTQIEAVVFIRPGEAIITSERSKTAAARAFSINTSRWVSSNPLALPIDHELCKRRIELDAIDDGYQLYFPVKQSQPFVVELLDADNHGFFRQGFNPSKPQHTFFLTTEKNFKTPGTLVINSKNTIFRCEIP
ncbi:MAG: hypothetical protein LWX09_09400 [Bacteroidia bacterium]|jgi:hypothetical protein|nr:hypothetical protein [Bacteroidia bacterium]